MFCSNCGAPVPEDAKFCPSCGAPVPQAQAPGADPIPVQPAPETPAADPAPVQPEAETPVPQAPTDEPVLVVEPSPAAQPVGEPQLTLNGMDAPRAPEPPVMDPAPPAPPAPPVNNGGAGTPPSGGAPDKETLTLILRIVCGLLGAVFAWFTLRHAFGLLQYFFNYISLLGHALRGYYPAGVFGWSISFVLHLILDVVEVLAPLVAAAVLLLAAIKWEEKYNDLVFGGVAAAAVLRVLLLVFTVLVSIFLTLLSRLFGMVGGAYIGRSLLSILGYVAAAGIVFAVMYAVGCPPILGKAMEQVKDNILSAIRELTGGLKKTAPSAQTSQQRTAPTQTSAQPGQPQTPVYVPQAKKTDRSLLMYILLSIITCGIYSWIFIYGLAQDANEVCDGDGQTTGGLVAFILLGYITCGIYQLIWWYKLCNRMAANAPRYGLTFQENGTTFLVWELFGALLCGIGPFIALHIAIKNMNALCAAYNQRSGFYGATPGAQV